MHGFYFASTKSNPRFKKRQYIFITDTLASKDLMTHLKRGGINLKFKLLQNTDIARHSTNTAKSNCEGLPLFHISIIREKMEKCLLP